ncbi:MAG: hypothetical protein J2P53_08490, partial [Bradyrhizobiaceae bacterium]|nr:hypothetical protein [Bradyrhizobiaceae bacterium]
MKQKKLADRLSGKVLRGTSLRYIAGFSVRPPVNGVEGGTIACLRREIQCYRPSRNRLVDGASNDSRLSVAFQAWVATCGTEDVCTDAQPAPDRTSPLSKGPWMSKSNQPPGPPLDVLVLEGDGIGPEITAATLMVLEAAALGSRRTFKFSRADIGFKALRHSKSTMPDAVLEQARTAAGIILGPVSHNEYPPVAEGGLNPSGVLRKRLDLYANIRPARSRKGFPPRCGHPIDLVVVRENTEGFYADRSMFLGPGEFMPTPDVALAVRKITRSGSTRIAEEAFRLARQRRRKVTA